MNEISKVNIDRPRIDIYNSICDLTITPNINLNDLSHFLSYPDKKAQFEYLRRYKQFKDIRVYLLEPTHNLMLYKFPTGLLNKVEEYFEKKVIYYEKREFRCAPSTNVHFRKYNTLPELRSYQLEMLIAASKHPRGVVMSATGTGKTVMITELIYQKAVPTLVIVPSINILKQFYDILVHVFSEKHVGILSGKSKKFNKDIVISTFQALPGMPREFFDKFNMICMDEAHHGAAETIQSLNRTSFVNIYYRYHFTATPYRNDGSSLALEGIISSDVIFKYDTIEAMKDGYLAIPIFLVFHWEHRDIAQRKDYLSEYKTSIVESKSYNAKVAVVAEEMRKKGRHILIFVRQIEQGEMLKAMITNAVLITGKESPQSSQQILKDFEDKKIDILIGTSVIGEGVDMKSVDCAIMAGGGKAVSEVVQKIGRLLRPAPNKKVAYVVDFTHEYAKHASKHFKIREAIYKSYQTKIHYL